MLLADQTGKFGRAGDVRAFADVDKVHLGGDCQPLQTAQQGRVARLGERSRGVMAHDLLQLEDVLRGGAAAASHDVQQTTLQVVADHLGKHLRGLVITARDIRQSGIRVGRDAAGGNGSQPLQVGQQVAGSEGAIQADREQRCVGERGAEGLDGLPRKGATALVGQRARDHHRQATTCLLDSIEGRFGIERVEDGLDQDDVGTALHQPLDLLLIGSGQLGEGYLARRGVGDIGRERGGAICRAYRSGYKARLLGVTLRVAIGCTASNRGRSTGDLARVRRETIVGQRYGVGIKGVAGDDVGACSQIFFVNGLDSIGLCEREQIATPLERGGVVGKTRGAVVGLGEPILLHHGSETAIEQQDARFEGFIEVYFHGLISSIS